MREVVTYKRHARVVELSKSVEIVEIGRSLWITRTRYYYLLIVNFTSHRFGENKKMIPSVTGKYFQSCLLK